MKLRSGSVLPHGLLSQDTQSAMAGFSKTYENYPLRMGIVVRSYPTSSDQNISKLSVEYDVVVIEQDGNRAITPITYKNCLSSDGLGSIADFFEVRRRTQKKKTRFEGKDPASQDGAIVLLLCLDGSSEKAIILGGLNHPQRKSKLVGDETKLAGEFNGLAIEVNDDGSANLTFKGATDNEGKPKDTSQGNTTIDIEKDGTLQFKHKGVTTRMEKVGKVLLNAEDSITIKNKKDVLIESIDKDDQKKVSVQFSKGVLTAEMVELIMKATGSATVTAQKVSLEAETMLEMKGQQVSIESGSIATLKGSVINIDGLVFAGGSGGQPTLIPTTQYIGTGNLGAPVLSTAIGPFATKVFVN
jgi:hypothetical protein